MPQENKKRNRRAEAQKRKREEFEEGEEGEGQGDASFNKRPRTAEDGHVEDNSGEGEGVAQILEVEGEGKESYEYQEGYEEYSAIDDAGNSIVRPFYGLLDEEEQAQFKRAEDDLEVNEFTDHEDRRLFLRGLYEQAEGKELKIACSQACSRLLERMILLSSPEQLKHLFKEFNGQFLNLVQHRFASHCCEALFIKAAPIVSEEQLQPIEPADSTISENDGEAQVTMENLFLYTINELEGNLGYLLTDRFASHTLRVLLSVLSGRELDAVSSRSLLKSKNKENIHSIGGDQVTELKLEPRAVPKSFTSALEKMMNDAVYGLDTTYLRALATHQTGNPTLQLLLRLESEHFGKQKAKDEKSLLRKLLPDDQVVDGTDSASFVNGLLYDPVGSRLMETIVECAPGKLFKTLYQHTFKERMGSLARNETASYVVSRVLERLSGHDLSEATTAILRQLPNLAERGRTSVVKTLVERCAARGLDPKPLAQAIQLAFPGASTNEFSLENFLHLPENFRAGDIKVDVDTLFRTTTSLSNQANSQTGASELSTSVITSHASLLAQSMLAVEGPLSALLFDAINQLEQRQCLQFALNPNLSPILQKSLTVKHASLIFRRKLITRFYSYISRLSQHPCGSHLVDAIWSGTHGLAFARERVAEELAEDGRALHESKYGRIVWRNWRMVLYCRHRSEWVRQIRNEAGNEAFLSFPDDLASAIQAPENSSRLSEGAASSRNGTDSPVPMSRRSSNSRHHHHHHHHHHYHGHRQAQQSVTPSEGSSSHGGIGTKTRIELARERFARAHQLQPQQQQQQHRRRGEDDDGRQASSGGGGGGGAAATQASHGTTVSAES